MTTPEDCPADPESMHAAIDSAARKVLADRELMSNFWRGGVGEVARHIREWIGGKVIAFLWACALAACVYLALKFGVIK